jgi:hypothetical protein
MSKPRKTWILGKFKMPWVSYVGNVVIDTSLWEWRPVQVSLSAEEATQFGVQLIRAAREAELLLAEQKRQNDKAIREAEQKLAEANAVLGN